MSQFAAKAKELLLKLEAAERRKNVELPPLGQFIVKTSPRLTGRKIIEPVWYQEVLDLFDRAIDGEPIRGLINCPPQTSKSTIVQHGIAKCLIKDPERTHAYISYDATFARLQSNKVQSAYLRAGGKLGNKVREDYWENDAGGFVFANGFTGLTGHPITGIIVIDDPYYDFHDYASGARRKRLWEFVQGTVKPRTHDTTSIFVIHTRWGRKDLTGQLKKEEPELWDHLSYEALDSDGKSICEEVQPTEKLLEIKKKQPRIWSALYDQNPDAEGGRMFNDPKPEQLCKMADVPQFGVNSVGVDLAYTEKTYNDGSAIVTLRRAPNANREMKYWVCNVVYKREKAKDFSRRIAYETKIHHCSAYWYTSSTEQGTAEVMDAPVIAIRASVGKMTRAIPFSDAWNVGDVMIPVDAPWYEMFVDHMTEFTGLDDPEDDIADAGVAAFDRLDSTSKFQAGYAGSSRSRAGSKKDRLFG